MFMSARYRQFLQWTLDWTDPCVLEHQKVKKRHFISAVDSVRGSQQEFAKLVLNYRISLFWPRERSGTGPRVSWKHQCLAVALTVSAYVNQSESGFFVPNCLRLTLFSTELIKSKLREYGEVGFST